MALELIFDTEFHPNHVVTPRLPNKTNDLTPFKCIDSGFMRYVKMQFYVQLLYNLSSLIPAKNNKIKSLTY